jgi:TldD protein
MNRWNLDSYRGLLGDYTELRAQENRTMQIAFLNGQIVTNSNASEIGISARNFLSGSWGFASHPEITKESVEKVMREAKANAQFMGRHSLEKTGMTKIPGARAEIDLSTRKAKISSPQLIERIKEYDVFISKHYPQLISRTLRCFQQDFIKEGINSEGALTFTHFARSFVVVTMGLESENGPVEVKEIFGDSGQIEDTLPDMETFRSRIENVFEHLKNKAKGISPEGGLKEVILSSNVAGILAHEAIGHTTEADIVMGGSAAADYLGKPVASHLVSLVDFAHTAFGKQAPMPVLFDDEGTLATDTTIIDKGVLKTFMNNKATSHRLDQMATGHARAWGFNDEPLIRMRNTAILPGKDKIEDMIASIDDGYYLLDHSNGQADSTSEFMFGVPLGYEIKNGRLGRALLDSTISGVAFDMLKTVSMVSDEMTWVSYGTCGKKQPMTVGMGGPAIKCKIHIGGK